VWSTRLQNLLRKVYALRFLLRSRQKIFEDFGGPGSFLRWFITNLAEQGAGTVIGKMMSRTAFLRRADANLYLDWIKSVEVIPSVDPSVSLPQVGIVVFLREDNVRFVKRFVQHLEDERWVRRIDFVLTSSCDLEPVIADCQTKSRIFIHRIADSKLIGSIYSDDTVDGVVVLHTLCLFQRSWVLAVYNQFLSGSDAIIFDHDQIVNKQRARPRFKPGYCKELLFDPSYVPVAFVDVKLFQKMTQETVVSSLSGAAIVSGCLLLAKEVSHISDILVHLLAPAPEWKDEIDITSKSMVRMLVDKTHEFSHYPELYEKPEGDVLVSILIPICDKIELTKRCVHSILKHAYRFEIEILVLDNQSSDPETLSWLAEQSMNGVIKTIVCDYNFNWSKVNNDGIQEASGDFLILLNNDTEVITPDWVDRLVMLGLQEEIGTVGPLLLYPDRLIQHAGVVIGYGGYADHVFSGETIEDRGEEIFISPLVRREVLASTGACLAFSRQTYNKVGKFSEQLDIAGDIDFCLRAHSIGSRNFLDPATVLLHLESKTRTKGLPEKDKRVLEDQIIKTCPKGDPFFNKNLSLSSLSPMPRLY